MKKILTFIIAAFLPLASYAFSLGDKLNYTIYVSNQTTNTFIANGQTIPANTSRFVLSQSTDVIQTQSSHFVHPVTINGLDGQAVCTVTGHVDIGLPGSFSMSAENTNAARCSKSIGIYGGLDKLGLNVTVLS